MAAWRIVLLALVLVGCRSSELPPQEQAVALYAGAGVVVDIDIEIDEDGLWCGGRIWAYYDKMFDLILVCDPEHPNLVAVLVHEIAHHLDALYFDDETRGELLELWGLEHWYGGRGWLESGAEWFAESVTRSLMPDAPVQIEAPGGLDALLGALP